jgi:hypothetical protein
VCWFFGLLEKVRFIILFLKQFAIITFIGLFFVSLFNKSTTYLFLKMLQLHCIFTLFLMFFTQNLVNASFSFGFRKFLSTQYGPEVEAQLTRLDFAERGSFGGSLRSVPAKTA